MKKEQKSLIKKALEFLSLSMNDTIELAKYVTADGAEIEVGEDGTTSATDGEYTLEDGKVLTVAEGKATIAEPVKEDEVVAAEDVQAEAPVADISSAIEWLQKAVDLHKKHMDGSAPTDESSQMEMMNQMEKALSFLKNDSTEMKKKDMKMSEYLESEIVELKARITELETAKEVLTTEKETLSAQITELQKEPAVDSVNLSTDNKSTKLSPVELRLQAYFDNK